MTNEYRNNHYVPIWYQKRFVHDPKKDFKLHYLDLNPPKVFDSKGVMHSLNERRFNGFKSCFSEIDLYTAEFGETISTEIEKRFFGNVDTMGQKAVEYFNDFAYPWDGTHLSNEMALFMSVQKLRTPKALEWLKHKVSSKNKNQLLQAMIRLQQLHCAIWSEGVWLIADASESDTKFIISDHPVTVYNRACGPQWSKRNGDPEIWRNGTHTIFPLSQNKILILTNLSWVRNPYQDEKSFRPNPNPFRSAIFKVTEIQTLRKLSEQEVRQINFIIKSQAKQYIAAAEIDWLYPERYISKSDWPKYGHGYLLMPDPRPVHLGGTIMWGGGPGPGGAMDEYGRRPWESGFERERKGHKESDTLYRFKGEFSRLFGPYRRGRSCNSIVNIDNEKDDDEFHKYHLELEGKHKENMRRTKRH
jgi:hypothetical protein